MKSVTPAMEAHLKEGATTLTTCWIITRPDGQVFRYTELDEDITFEGELYRSAAGFNKSAITSSATFAVDKMEVTGFLRDDGITDDEIRNGAFDHASVEVFLINYITPSMGKIRLRAGWFGEVRTTGSGAFLVELRGLVDQLQVKIGGTYLPECPVDLGSPKCGIQLIPAVRQGGRPYKMGDRVLWPVESPGYVGAKHFPDLVDPNIPDVWWHNNVVTADLNVTPFKGPKFLTHTTGSLPGTMTRSISVAVLGLTPEEIAAQLYKVNFRAKFYRYNVQTSGQVRIRQYRSNNQIISTVDVQIEDKPPAREWIDIDISANLDPQTARMEVMLTINPDPAGVMLAQMCWDDMDFWVSYREEQVNSFALYGGVEFQCVQAGVAALEAPTFDPALGMDTVDGGVIWRAVDPKYTHLRTLNETMTSTNTVFVDPIALPWSSYLEWGVLKFLTGPNTGRSMEIMSYDPVTGKIVLVLPLPYRGIAGDKVSIQAGCNKTASNCKLFNNILNFRGHPRVPGQGQYFKVAGL